MSSVTGFICRVKADVSDRFHLQSSLMSSVTGFICRVKPDVPSDRFYLQGQAICHQ